MQYKIDDYLCNVYIEKKNNKNTYIRVKEDLNIYVTTNYFTSEKQIIKLLDNNYNYLLKMLNNVKHRNEKKELFYYLGKKYDIIHLDGNIELYDDKIYVKNEENLNKWYKNQIKKIFKERLDYNYNLFTENIPYPNLRIRKMKTRWGVCNKKTNTVTLNSELIKYDISKIDYVIIHELSHFLYFNHSHSFWNQVEKYCPNYKKIRKELKD
jgi:predicted metal-dependent hydrolase